MRKYSCFSVFLLFLPVLGQELSDNWIVSVYGRSVPVASDGSFRIPDVVLLDEFGDSQQDRFDGKSDDFIRLTGFKLDDGLSEFVHTEPFQLMRRRGLVQLTTNDLVFTDTPQGMVEFVRVEAPQKRLTSFGQTVQCTTLAFAPNATATFADNDSMDVSRRADFTTYRSTNPRIASVSKDGLVTAHRRGVVYISAMHDNVSASIRISVEPPRETFLAGILRDESGNPVADAQIEVAGYTNTTTTGSDGRFTVPNLTLPANAVPVVINVTAPDGRMTSQSMDPVLDGITTYQIMLMPFMSLAQGQVVDHLGTPVALADLVEQGSGASGQTDASGEFSFNVPVATPTSSLTVIVFAPDGRTVTGTVASASGVADFGTLMLPAPLTDLLVSVRDDGNPVSGLAVSIPGISPDLLTDTNGAISIAGYAITNTAPISISVVLPDGRNAIRMVVPQVGGSTSFLFDFAPLETDVVGRLLNSVGIPVPGALVSIPEVPGASTMTASNGAFQFTNLPITMDGQLLSAAAMVVTPDGRAVTGTVSAVLAGQSDFGDLVLAPLQTQLTGQVLEADGTPAANAMVSFEHDPVVASVSEVTTDASGAYTFPAVSYEYPIGATAPYSAALTAVSVDGRDGTATISIPGVLDDPLTGPDIFLPPTNRLPVITSSPVNPHLLPGLPSTATDGVAPLPGLSLCLEAGETSTEQVSINVAGSVDIVFIVDQSGSMETEHQWIGEMIPQLEAELNQVGITDARYALVGYTDNDPSGGAENTVVHADLGSVEDFIAATNSLRLDASAQEDGYYGIWYALNNVTFRPGAVKNFVLVSDEHRTDDDGSLGLNFERTLDLLNESGVVLNTVVNGELVDTNNIPAVGVASDGTAYLTNNTGSVIDSLGGRYTRSIPIDGGTVADTKEDYIDMAWLTGGATWDLNRLREGGDAATSFTKAFTAIKAEEIRGQLEVFLAASDSAAIFTNLTGSTMGDSNGTYTFSVEIGSDGTFSTYDLVFSDASGNPLGSLPVVINSKYEYTPMAIDPDGDPLTWTLVEGPAEMTIDPSTGMLFWDTGFVSAGSYPIEIRVSDGRGGIDTQAFDLEVTIPTIQTDLQITVRDTNGGPIENASVTIPALPNPIATDANGMAAVPGYGLSSTVPISVTVSLPDGQNATISMAPVIDGATTYLFEFSLTKTDATGRIVDSQGNPVVDASVQIQPGLVLTTDGDGRFTATGVIINSNGESLTASATAPDGRIVSGTAPAIASATTDFGTLMLPATPGAIRGQVINGFGTPMANVPVEIIGFGTQTTTDATGNFLLQGAPVDIGPVTVQASDPILGVDVENVTPAPGQDAGPVELQLGFPSNAGTEFILAFQQNAELDPNDSDFNPVFDLFVSSADSVVTGTITYAQDLPPRTFILQPDSLGEVQIDDPVANQVAGRDAISRQGIRLNFSSPVRVFGLNSLAGGASTDGFTAIPVSQLGTEYMVVAYPGLSGELSEQSQLAVVASEDNTQIQIIPTITSSHGGTNRIAGVPYMVQLQALDVYQLGSDDAGEDLSGTRILSVDPGKPIAVFSGAACGYVPRSFNYCDHLVEQMLPVSAWGREYISLPLFDRAELSGGPKGDFFQVIAAEDGTSVSVQGPENVSISIDAGQVWTGQLSGVNRYLSDKPIQVAQLANGTRFARPSGPNFGDPFLMILPAESQFLPEYIFSTTDILGDEMHFLNVIAHKNDVLNETLLLDGSPISPAQFSFEDVPGTDYQCAKGVLGGEIKSYRITGSMPFGIYVYGFGNDDSYGYPGGIGFPNP